MKTALAMLVMAAGCTGASWGENEPGQDTLVDPPPVSTGEHRMGAIAVERDEDQLWIVHEAEKDGEVRANLTAIDPLSGETAPVLDVSGTSDRRVVFPSPDRMILLAQRGAQDTLVLFDTTTRSQLASVTKHTWYWGTRTSPSGRALVVADNATAGAPLHVIDTSTLEHRALVHGGEEIEAMWNHGEDVLFALSVTDPLEPTAVARVHRYDLRGADLSAELPAPTRTWEVGGYGWDYFFSYTWISISPDNRWVVFPLVEWDENGTDPQHMLFIIDQQTGATALTPGMGPVDFTRDGRTIISYGWNAAADAQDLWLIDPVTRARKVVDLPFTGSLMFHAARNADYIVCVPVLGSGPPAVYDLAHDTVREIDTPSLALYDFITRPTTDELWIESAGSVFGLDLSSARLSKVPLGGAVASTINVRPLADEAVVGDSVAVSVRRIDMANRTQVGSTLHIPSPFDAPAPVTLAPRRARVAERFAVPAQSAFDPAFASVVERRPGRMNVDQR